MNGMYIDLAKATINDDALIVDIPEDMPFGKAVSDPASLNKLVITTAYDGPKTFDCVVAGRQAEITEITDANGNKIEEAGRGTVVKIVGKYFATFQKMSFNGQQIDIEPASVESSCITFTVPTDTEEFQVGEGTLKIVNAYDETGISKTFKFLGFVPSVTAVSYTMPKPGNVIRLTGVNLLQDAEVFFPAPDGEKKGEVQKAAGDGTSIYVLVPEGVGDKAGYLRIVSEGNETTVKGIVMFYKQGVFLREFTDDELKTLKEDIEKIRGIEEQITEVDNKLDTSGASDSKDDDTIAFNNVSGKDFDGNDVEENLFSKNAVTVMNFWFTGCKPCVAELSKLNELNDAIKSMGGEVVGVNTDTFDGKEATIKEAKKILESQGAKYRNFALDANSDAGKYASEIMAFPTTILVDRKGNIVGEPMVGGIDNQENYDTLMKQIKSVIEADSANK